MLVVFPLDFVRVGMDDDRSQSMSLRGEHVDQGSLEGGFPPEEHASAYSGLVEKSEMIVQWIGCKVFDRMKE